MKAVQVKYKVKAEYVSRNKTNVQRVMDRLKKDPIDGMLYSTYILEDGQTFVHINIARDQATLSKLQEVQEFTDFRMELKASQPIEPPKATPLELVGAGFDL